MNMRELQEKCRADLATIDALSGYQRLELENHFRESAVALRLPIAEAKAAAYAAATMIVTGKTEEAVALLRVIALIDYIIEQNHAARKGLPDL